MEIYASDIDTISADGGNVVVYFYDMDQRMCVVCDSLDFDGNYVMCNGVIGNYPANEPE